MPRRRSTARKSNRFGNTIRDYFQGKRGNGSKKGKERATRIGKVKRSAAGRPGGSGARKSRARNGGGRSRGPRG